MGVEVVLLFVLILSSPILAEACACSYESMRVQITPSFLSQYLLYTNMSGECMFAIGQS